MTNWSRNFLTMSHPDHSTLKKAEEAFNSGKFLSIMIPEPQYQGRDDWYEWRSENWGPKWDVGRAPDSKHIKIESSSVQAWFDSANCPPVPAFETLTKQDFHFEVYFDYEGEEGVVGTYISGEGYKEYKYEEGDSLPEKFRMLYPNDPELVTQSESLLSHNPTYNNERVRRSR